jgi:hypothetical protein
VSTIRCVYSVEPPFPPTDQHPDALRYQVGGYFVDAIGGEPTVSEVAGVLGTSFTSQRAVVMLDLQQRRDVLVSVITALQGDFLAAGDSVNANLAKTIKQGLYDIEVQPVVVAAQTVSALEQAILAAYTELVVGAPLSVKQAFAKYARRVS